MEPSAADFSFLDYTQDEGDGSHAEFRDYATQEAGAGASQADGLTAALSAQLTFQESLADGGGAGGAAGAGADDAPPPEWACAYCGYAADPASVARCLATGRWFCNGRGGGAASCIVAHLVRSKNKEVALHRASPLGDAVLECYATGARNVFSLGYVPLRDENTVVLLGRDTPPSAPAIKDLNVDVSAWQPLVEGRALVDWLVRRPPGAELARCRPPSAAQAAALEAAWRTDPGATLESLLEQAPEALEAPDPLPVALRYPDGYAYQSLWGALVDLEADHDRRAHEGSGREGVTVTWGVGLNRRPTARFFFPRDSDLRLVPGDELRLRHPCPRLGSPPWEGVGVVFAADDASEEVAVELRPAGAPGGAGGRKQFLFKGAARHGGARAAAAAPAPTGPPPVDAAYGYSVEYVWNGAAYERMRAAVRAFALDETSVSGHLYHRLLGRDGLDGQELRAAVPARLSAPGLPELNHSQAAAVARVLRAPLSLIQGPPGTGKTVTCASLVYHLARQGGGAAGQVLVCAPSNVAVDHLAERVALTGLRVVRLQARSREAVAAEGVATSSPGAEALTLSHQARAGGPPELRKLHALRCEAGELSLADERRYRALLRAAERAALAAADVVCATCSGAGDPRLAALRFRRVLIDEATQAVEPEALVPLVLGAKQAVLVGDHCQLGPVVLSKPAAAAGMGQSLFERLMLLGVRPIRLAVQYRMHPWLSAFPSAAFYEGALQNGVSAAERTPPAAAFPWPAGASRPGLFWAQSGAEEISPSGTSYLNRAEAAAVERAVTQLLRAGVPPAAIGIITPYEGQRAHVVATLARAGPLRAADYAAVECASVDSFQGREKDYIVLSCVRSNEGAGIGFLSDPRRLNVALTRARYGLIVTGNPRVLSRQPVWAALLHHFRAEGALVEGPLAALRPAAGTALSRPARLFDAGAFAVGGAAGADARFRPVAVAGERRHDHDHHHHHDGARDRERAFPPLAPGPHPYAIPDAAAPSPAGARRGGGGGDGRRLATQATSQATDALSQRTVDGYGDDGGAAPPGMGHSQGFG